MAATHVADTIRCEVRAVGDALPTELERLPDGFVHETDFPHGFDRAPGLTRLHRPDSSGE